MIELVGQVRAVCVGSVRALTLGRRSIKTAFVKSPVDGPLRLGELGVPGDEHVYEDHGGPEMAALVYPFEHYSYWREFGLDLPEAGAFGENLTVTGLVETDVHLGDVFEVGTSVVLVTQPRSPCYKIAARYGDKNLSVTVQNEGLIVYLLRVLDEGDVSAGDPMRLVHRDSHGVTVAEAGRVANVDRNDLDAAERVLAVEALGSSTRRKLAARMASRVEVGLDAARLFVPEDGPSS